MLIKKLITVIKLVEFSFRGVKIRKSVHSNISMSVCAYNHGMDLRVGQVYVRANVCLNTDGEGSLYIGNGVFINRNSIISCRCKTTVSDNCIIGPNVCIYDHDHNMDDQGVQKGYLLGEVIIGENCWIGAGAIILKGTHIGANSVIAAGAIVKGEYPSNSMIYSKHETLVKKLASRNKATTS